MNLTISRLLQNSIKSEEISIFFEKYPYEKFYCLNLKLDEITFRNFLIDKLNRRLNQAENIWQIRIDNKLIAIFGIEQDNLISTIYRKKIFQIVCFYNFTSHSREVFRLINNKIEEFCLQNSVEMVRCKIDAEDHNNISYFLEEHFHYYASSCKIYYDVESLGIPKVIAKHRYRVRRFESKDELFILSILKQHKKNEKYYNLDLPEADTIKIFEEYFKIQSINKATTTLVLEDLINDNIVGVSMYNTPDYFNSKLNKKLITWDLIVVDAKERGNGLGNLFFSYMINEKESDIELSTMSDNLQMLKFLHKLGFYKVGEFNYLSKKLK